jgi:hypothetical protein
LHQHPHWVAHRAASLDPLGADVSASVQLNRGAAMSQRQVLDLVLDQLA